MARYRLPGEEVESKGEERNCKEKSLAWIRILKEQLAASTSN
ncbi:hypothetical protein [Orenia metallireducens]|jgi:hypothetical protein|nr:hypothetical protein [Orenia metallireducens]